MISAIALVVKTDALQSAAGMSDPRPQVFTEFFALTDTGRQRSENQDSCAALGLGAERGSLLVVCDGMGGHEGGALASQIAHDVVVGVVQSAPEQSERALLHAALNLASRMVWERGRRESRLSHMGTTCVAALVQDEDVWVANVGDSRAYLIGAQRTEQLTQDHTLLNELVKSGHNIPNIDTHPERNIITRCIGMDAEVHVDLFDCRLERGAALLLCSDGLTAHVESREFASAFEGQSVKDGVRALIDLANLRGGSDNIAVAVLRRSEHDPATFVTAAPQRPLQLVAGAFAAAPTAAEHAPLDSRPRFTQILRRLGLAALGLVALIFLWLYYFFP